MKTHPSNSEKKNKNIFEEYLNCYKAMSISDKAEALQPWGHRTASVPRYSALQGFRCKFPGFSRVGPGGVSQSRSKELCTVQWDIPGGLCYLSFTNSKQTNKKDFKS